MYYLVNEVDDTLKVAKIKMMTKIKESALKLLLFIFTIVKRKLNS